MRPRRHAWAIYRFSQLQIQGDTKYLWQTEAQKPFFFFFLVVSTGQNTTSWSMGLNSCRETWKHRAMTQVDLNNCSATTYHMDIFIYQDQHPRQTMPIMRKATTKYCCFFPYKFHNWNCVWVKKGMLREEMAFAIQSSIDYWWGACVWVVLMTSVLPSIRWWQWEWGSSRTTEQPAELETRKTASEAVSDA